MSIALRRLLSVLACPLIALCAVAQSSVPEVGNAADKAQQVFEHGGVLTTEPPAAPVNTYPVYPGGEGEMRRFIAEHTHYPIEAMDNGVQGRVYVGFVVEADGSMDSVRVLHGAHPALDAEAERVVRLLQGWTPATMNGKPVRVSYQLPITFQLAEDPPKKKRAKR